MKFIMLFIMLFIMSMLLYSCTIIPSYSQGYLMHLKKDMTINEAAELFDAHISYEVVSPQTPNYLLAYINYNNWSWRECRKNMEGITECSNRYYNCEYYLFFKDEKLYYWGYGFELLNSSDPVIKDFFTHNTLKLEEVEEF